MAGLSSTAIDSFFLKYLIDGYSPKIFIDKLRNLKISQNINSWIIWTLYIVYRRERSYRKNTKAFGFIGRRGAEQSTIFPHSLPNYRNCSLKCGNVIASETKWSEAIS